MGLDAFRQEVGDESFCGGIVGDFIDGDASTVGVCLFVGGNCRQVCVKVSGGGIRGEGSGADVVGVKIVGEEEVYARVKYGTGCDRVVCLGRSVNVDSDLRGFDDGGRWEMSSRIGVLFCGAEVFRVRFR